MILFLYLKAIGNKTDSILLILIAWVTIVLSCLFVEFFKRRKYFDELENTLDTLEKPYLISEVMETSYHLYDQKYKEIIKKSNKSVIDTISRLEADQKDYKEYIESWIHEVKLPLTSIKLICDNNKNDITRRIQYSLTELENDVEKALFYARSDSVYQDYLIREIDLKPIIMGVITRNKQYLIQNQISVQTDCGDSIVFCDSKWVDFIVNQILINAVKYKKEDTGNIIFSTQKIKNGMKLMIEDNGIGIKESEITRIFDKGFTGTNGRDQVKSTGIGLYLCKKLCNKLGLEIAVESKENQYTRILLIFPKGTYLSKL